MPERQFWRKSPVLEGVKPKLSSAEHKQYHTIVGKLTFLANECPDIQYCVKECARGVEDLAA